MHAANEVIRHTDVERATRTAGEDVDPETLHAEYLESSYAGLTRVSVLRRGRAKPHRSYTTAERQHGLPGL